MKTLALLPLGLCSLFLAAVPNLSHANSETNACVNEWLATADDSITLAELRKQCRIKQTVAPTQYQAPAIQARMEEQAVETTAYNRRIVLAHRPTYFTMGYYSRPNSEPFQLVDDELQRFEAKFQLSFKVPVWTFNPNTKLFFAYTGRSWWQVFDQDRSRPFRETNHQPEFFMEWSLDNWHRDWLPDLDGLDVRLGAAHESNGQTVALSRSWNRIYLEVVARDHSVLREGDQVYFSLNPWLRIPEKDKDSPTDPTGDENPNIERYVGQAQMVLAWRRSQASKDSYSLRIRNNLRADNRGLIELSWGHKINESLEVVTQLISGHGETLLDYDRYTNRITVGARLTNWF